MRYEVVSKFSDIIAKTFPDFKGKEVKVIPEKGPINCKSYWSEGRKELFQILRYGEDDSFGTTSRPINV